MILFHEGQGMMTKRNKSKSQQFRHNIKQLYHESCWAYCITSIPKLLQERQQLIPKVKSCDCWSLFTPFLEIFVIFQQWFALL